MNKTVYSFDPVTRAYLAPVELNAGDLSPLEPGKWLIPGGCLEDAPPTPAAGQYVAEEAGAWVLRSIPEVSAPPPAPFPSAPPAVDPFPGDAARAVRDGIQQYMDSRAQALGYDDIRTAVTYADEPVVPKFQAEGQAFRTWRSLVWAACYAHLSLVESGEAPIPTLAEAIAMLPPLELP